MSSTESKRVEVLGSGVTNIDVPPNAIFKVYTADRPAPTPRLRATENVIDVSITLAYPVKQVWPIFKEFDLWMNRFGYYWDGVPANNEDNIVSLVNKPGANDYKYSKNGAQPRYIVRKVIPEQLIYFDALPCPLPDIDGTWTGHTVVSLREEAGQTKITFFMEHTLYSDTVGLDVLCAEVKQGLPNIIAFWRDYFVRDLNQAIDSRLGGGSKEDM